MLVDDDGRPFCRDHAEQVSPTFGVQLADYKAGVREQALLKGLQLGWHRQHGAQSETAESVEVLRDQPHGLDDWSRVGAAVVAAQTTGSDSDTTELRRQADGLLEAAGIPSFNAQIIRRTLNKLIAAKEPADRQRLAGELLDTLVDAAQRMDMNNSKNEKLIAFSVGVIFLGVLTYAGLRQGATIDAYRFYLLRVVAAVSAAGVAAMIPGFIAIEATWAKIALRAGGALGVFAVVYTLNPPELVRPTKDSAPTGGNPAPSTEGGVPHPGGERSDSGTPTAVRPEASCASPKTGNFDTTWFYSTEWQSEGEHLAFAKTSLCDETPVNRYKVVAADGKVLAEGEYEVLREKAIFYGTSTFSSEVPEHDSAHVVFATWGTHSARRTFERINATNAVDVVPLGVVELGNDEKRKCRDCHNACKAQDKLCHDRCGGNQACEGDCSTRRRRCDEGCSGEAFCK